MDFNLSVKISEKQLEKTFNLDIFSIVNTLRSDKRMNSFFEPVDSRRMGISGFYDQFINSIDIRSLEEKIRSGKIILTKQSLLNYIKRMINNSLLYNGNLHTMKEICLKLKKTFISLAN